MQPQNALKVIPLEEVGNVPNETDDKMDLEVNTVEVSSQRLSRGLAMIAMTIGISLIGCASSWYADGREWPSRVLSSRPAKHVFVDLVMKTFLRPFSSFR